MREKMRPATRSLQVNFVAIATLCLKISVVLSQAFEVNSSKIVGETAIRTSSNASVDSISEISNQTNTNASLTGDSPEVSRKEIRLDEEKQKFGNVSNLTDEIENASSNATLQHDSVNPPGLNSTALLLEIPSAPRKESAANESITRAQRTLTSNRSPANTHLSSTSAVDELLHFVIQVSDALNRSEAMDALSNSSGLNIKSWSNSSTLTGNHLKEEANVTGSEVLLEKLGIRKCCQFGEIASDANSTIVCSPKITGSASRQTTESWLGKLAEFDQYGNVLRSDPPGDFQVLHGIPECDGLQVIVNEGEGPKLEKLAVFTDGRLFTSSDGQFFEPSSFCVDEFANSSRGAAVCASKAWLSPPMLTERKHGGRTMIPKCCPENQMFNSEMNCIPSGGNRLVFPVTNSKDGSDTGLKATIKPGAGEILAQTCPEIRPVFYGAKPFYVLEDSRLYFPHKPAVFSSDHYCLESVEQQQQEDAMGTLAIVCLSALGGRLDAYNAYCRDGTLCALKCCPEGQWLQIEEHEVGCAALPEGQAPWLPVFYDDQFKKVAVSEDKYKVVDVPQDCGKTMSLPLYPDSSHEEAVYLLKSGQIYSKSYAKYFSPPDYCMDHVIMTNTTTNEKVVTNVTLVCFPDESKLFEYKKIYTGCLVISSIFLLVTLGITLMLPDVNWLGTWTMLSYVVCMLAASIFLIVIFLERDLMDRGVCIGIAIAQHFTILSSFLWLNVMSFDVWYENFFWYLRRSMPMTRRKLLYRYLKRCAYSFGIPAVIVVVILILEYVPGLPDSFAKYPIDPEKRCWFRNNESIWLFMYGPICLILVANLVFFIFTMIFLLKHRHSTRMLNMSKKQMSMFRLFTRLFVVMGVGWLIEVVSWGFGPSDIWLVTDIVNALTGVLVFTVFICRPQTLRNLKKFAVERGWSQQFSIRHFRVPTRCRTFTLTTTSSWTSTKTGSTWLAGPASNQEESAAANIQNIRMVVRNVDSNAECERR